MRDCATVFYQHGKIHAQPFMIPSTTAQHFSQTDGIPVVQYLYGKRRLPAFNLDEKQPDVEYKFNSIARI